MDRMKRVTREEFVTQALKNRRKLLKDTDEQKVMSELEKDLCDGGLKYGIMVPETIPWVMGQWADCHEDIVNEKRRREMHKEQMKRAFRSKIKVGVSKEQVREILGIPNSVLREHTGKDVAEGWDYSDYYSLVTFLNGKFYSSC